MTKKSDYLALADTCLRTAGNANGAARTALLKTEAEWRRLALACYDVPFGRTPSARADLRAAR